MNLQGNRREVKELRTKIVAAIVAATNFHTKKLHINILGFRQDLFFKKHFFQVFTIVPRLNHLEYWLAGRHRRLLSLLKAEPFKIPKTPPTTGQKVVASQIQLSYKPL